MIDSPGHLADRPATPADLLRSPQEFADPSALEEAALGLDADRDRKSTRLNSSHSQISYAVFCLKKKKKSMDGTCVVSNILSKRNSDLCNDCIVKYLISYQYLGPDTNTHQSLLSDYLLRMSVHR